MTRGILYGFLISVMVPAHAGLAQAAQTPQAATNGNGQNHLTAEGLVVSSTRTTLVVKTNGDEYRLFELDSDTTRPSSLPIGATVQVEATPGANPTVPVASRVQVKAPPAVTVAPTGAPGSPAQPGEPAADDQIPASIRKMEKDLGRQTSRWRVGGRAGVAMDQELVMFGVQSHIGPFFNDNTWARPSLEFGFGELTTLVALNLEGAYRTRFTSATSNWSTFFGLGLGINFIDRNFSASEMAERTELDPEDTDTGDFSVDFGLNLIGGIQTRRGMFLELRAGAYSQPTLRFVVGYNFY